MAIADFKNSIEKEDLPAVQKIMYEETSAGYQVYNPFVFPVEFKKRTLLEKKMESLKYTPELFDGYTVADLGCSMGFFAFLALGYGAKKVVGYDNRDFYVQAGNVMAKKYAKLFPQTTGRIAFQEMDLSSLPDLNKQFDVLMVNSLIHWFIMFKKTTFEECVDWMYRHCGKYLYFEGCVDSSEKVMQDHGVPRDLMNADKFLALLNRRFSDVKLIGKTTYNEKRIVVRIKK